MQDHYNREPIGGIGESSMPAEAAPWGWILADNAAYNGDISRPIRYMHDQQLRYLAGKIAVLEISLPYTLEAWGLPQLEEPGFWVGTVLPQIRAEVERRSRPPKTWGADSTIARLKALDIVDVAGRFTELQGSGTRLKGRCPLHEEKTASFYVYPDTQRWYCFGACGSGGDVVDLIHRMRVIGKQAA